MASNTPPGTTPQVVPRDKPFNQSLKMGDSDVVEFRLSIEPDTKTNTATLQTRYFGTTESTKSKQFVRKMASVTKTFTELEKETFQKRLLLQQLKLTPSEKLTPEIREQINLIDKSESIREYRVAEELFKLFYAIQTRSKLHFRFYLQYNGREIDVAMSNGFDQAEEKNIGEEGAAK